MPTVTAENLSPVVAIIAWFLLVLSTTGVIARLGFKYLLTRRFDFDDYLICVAFILSALQTGCVAISTDNGYGKPFSSLSREQVDGMLKSYYASQLLYIASLCFSKLCAVAFMSFLMQRTRNIEWVLMSIIVVWAVISEFAVAFECKLPEPWDFISGSCLDRRAWWDYFEATNLLTEVFLIVFPISMTLHIQMTTRKKVTVIVCFLTRILVIIAIVCELYYRSHLANAPDPILETWPVALCTQSIQCIAILVASVPHLKPFLRSLQSTGLRLYQLPGEEHTRSGYVYGKAKLSRQTEGSTTGPAGHELTRMDRGINRTVVTARADWDAQSQSSQTRIIRETRTWVVEEQYGGGSGNVFPVTSTPDTVTDKSDRSLVTRTSDSLLSRSEFVQRP